VWFENCSFHDFKLGPVVGTGSFGRVHVAHHIPTGQVCATKSLSKAVIVKTKQARRVLLLHQVFFTLLPYQIKSNHVPNYFPQLLIFIKKI
jgi:serine/threonine protein kinase